MSICDHATSTLDGVQLGWTAKGASPARSVAAPGRVEASMAESELARVADARGAEVRAGLPIHLARLWRYGLVLSRRRDIAEDLVQATCLRALERAVQFVPGTRLDRWLFSILHSVWLNEVRAGAVRAGKGFVDAETALVDDGARTIEAHVMAGQVLRQVDALPEAQRAAVFLCYVEGMTYREVADILAIPIGTVMSRLAAARARIAETMERGVPAAKGSSA